MGFGGSTGGGSNKIATSADVALSQPAAGQVLSYDSTSDKWHNTFSASGITPDVQLNDTSAASTNVSRINAALQQGNVFLPPGTIWINSAIRIPSNRSLVGAGMGKTWVKAVNGVDRNTPAVTNIGNTLTSHTTPDANIYIADLSIDRNFTNSGNWGSADINEAGSSVQLACVEHAVVERVYARAGHHNFDITASMYRNDGATAYAAGPSRWVTVRNCSAGAAYDDPFTTHHSQFVRFEDCSAIQDADTYDNGGIWTTNSHGFEADDGSLDIQIVRCYSYGFDAGFQVKSHPTAPPARRVVLEDCVADHTRVGFDLQAYPDTATGTLPTAYAYAADVRIIRCEARNIQITIGAAGQFQASIRCVGYSGVHVQDFTVRDSPGGYATFTNGASDAVIENVMFENSWSNHPYSSPGGAVNVAGDAGSNFIIRNVQARATAMNNPIVAVQNVASLNVTIDTVRGSGTGSYPAVRVVGWETGRSVTNVSSSGFTADITVSGDSGGHNGNYTRNVTG